MLVKPNEPDIHREYERALTLARLERYDEAREKFADFLSQKPDCCKAWVSWAQMEKRAESRGHGSSQRPREILQKGLTHNKNSACLIQAWGLTELKSGNVYAARTMLTRAVSIDSSFSPVLKWHPVVKVLGNIGSGSIL